MIVCFCMQRNDTDISRLIEHRGIEFIVSQAKKDGCGSCVSTMKKIAELKKKEVQD